MEQELNIEKYVLKSICMNPGCKQKVFPILMDSEPIEAETIEALREKRSQLRFGEPKEGIQTVLTAIDKLTVLSGPFICPYCFTVHDPDQLSLLVQGECHKT